VCILKTFFCDFCISILLQHKILNPKIISYTSVKRTTRFEFCFCHGDNKNSVIFFTTKNEENIMNKGTVKWFNADKGFGFITPEDGGKDLFVHHSEIQSGGQYATLNDGQAVEYEVGQGQKGPCANKVVAV